MTVAILLTIPDERLEAEGVQADKYTAIFKELAKELKDEAPEGHVVQLMINPPDVQYRAACSGLWYTDINAAGTINAVRVNGETFHPFRPTRIA